MSEPLDDQLEKELREAVQAVWLRRKDHVMSRVDVIATVVDSLLDGSATDDGLAAAKVEAHNLAGALGSFGFGRGTEIAERIEDADLRQGACDQICRIDPRTRG